jgi:hypothetical protein
MTGQSRPSFKPRPKGKTPAERSVEFDAQQAQLKAEAAERRRARADAAPTKSARRAGHRRALSLRA